MTKPVCPVEFTHAVPFARGAGHRTPATRLALDERAALLRAAADRFCVGLKDSAAADTLHVKLARYRASAWERDRIEDLPPRYRGTLKELLWRVLKVRDAPMSARSIRRILSRIRGQRDVVV